MTIDTARHPSDPDLFGVLSFWTAPSRSPGSHRPVLPVAAAVVRWLGPFEGRGHPVPWSSLPASWKVNLQVFPPASSLAAGVEGGGAGSASAFSTTNSLFPPAIGPLPPPGIGQKGPGDGSINMDLPFKRISELFNINYIIVSQVNPHVIPFLQTCARQCSSLIIVHRLTETFAADHQTFPPVMTGVMHPRWVIYGRGFR